MPDKVKQTRGRNSSGKYCKPSRYPYLVEARSSLRALISSF